jgi:gliding motility-associated-like protein
MILLGCFSMLSLSAQVVDIINVSTTPTSCSNSLDGSITFSISGGVSPYRWFIYSDSGIPDDSGGPTAVTTITSTGRKKYGAYLIVVRDFNDDAGTIFVSVDGPDSISIGSFGSVDISCNNANDGSITVFASGESGMHFFDLAGPVVQTNATGVFTGLPQGDYTVTVRDQGLCTTTDVTPVITINNPSLISATLDNITHVSCFGDFTGSIAITPSGGTPSGVGTGYTYAWTGPSGYTSNAEDISGLEAGDYFLTITDGNGCIANLGPYTVNQPSQINVVLNSSSDVLCFMGSDGTANISPSGGAGTYIYSWIGQVNGLVSNDQNPVNLVADTYNLTIEDAAGCIRTFTDFLTINEPSQLNITVDGVGDVNCSGGSDGFANITASGGTPGYSFLWTGANFGYTSTDEDPTGMPADDYSVTITDSNGCFRLYTDILTITEPPGILMTLDGTTDVSCFGGNDGSANITVTGGSPPYSFSWVGAVVGPASSLEDPSDLMADTYSLFILDSKGCFLSSFNFVVIDQPPGISVTVDQIIDVDCNGDSTGGIEITPAGGTPAYTYAWTGDNGVTSSDEDPINLPEGSYSLIITDGNSCIGDYDDLAYVAENPPITATFAVSDLNCGDPLPSNDGAIDVTVSGGVGPYTYNWNGPFGFTSSSEDISGLSPGNYILEVTDNLGCVMSFPVQAVGMPPTLTANTTQVDIDCFGAGDGSIDLTVAGGTPPYGFAWTGPSGFTANTEDISNLEAGPYSVTVTDNNGCPVSFVDIATIAEAAQILATTVKTDATCNGGSDGVIDVTVTGGVPPYSFAWTGPNGFIATTEDISGLAAGNYSLTVTDANTCVVVFTDLETILEPSPITVTYTQVDVSTCFDAPEGSISATGAGGTGTILYSLDGSTPDISGDFSGLNVGTYTLTLTDQNACSKDTLVEILGPPPLVINDIAVTDVTGCAGDSNGSLVITASGGTGSLEYSLDSIIFQASPIFTGLSAGLDTVYVRDANGCTTGDTLSVNEPAPVTAVVSKTDASFASLGSISISGAAGGTPPYEYSIQGPGGPFSSNTNYTDLIPATYHVVVRDQNGCEYNEMVDILDIVPLNVVINLSHVSCFGADDGSIEFVPQDAVGNVQYSIDNGGSFVSTPLFENLAGNTSYDLVAIDDDGKVFISSVTINEPTALTFSASVIDAQCNAFSPTGSVDITVSGGTGPYSFLWSDGSTDEDRTMMLAGTYTVDITDANSCVMSEMVIIGSDFTVVAYAGEDTSVCYGESVQLSGMGDHTPVWAPPEYLDQSDVLNPTTVPITEPITFTLSFTDTGSGCTNTDTVRVSPYPEVDISVTPDTFVLSGGSAQLEVFGGPYASYQWMPESSLNNSTIANPIATPSEATWYYVSVLNEYGCEERDSVFVDFLEDITVFNVFTPNGDGINEYFEIENADRFPDMLVEVYSRWGDLLFSTVGYHSGSWWDGRTRGQKAPVGTYYYVIIPYPGAKPLTGHVTIIR